MPDVTVEELTAALAAADEAALRVLASLLPDGESPQPAGGDLVSAGAAAARLAALAAARPGLGAALRLWAAAPPAGNSIAGDARITGPAVQARDISGGIHVHDHRRPAAQRPVPRQLMAEPAHFIGREQDLAALDGLRTSRTRPLIVVSGAAGVGKTALVSRWLSGISDQYPHGQLYADLQGHAEEEPADPGAVLGRFLRAFGVGHVPAALAEQTALWRTVTADLRIAVFLDNAYSAAQVRPLLAASASALAVVTSRRRLPTLGLDGAGFHQVEVMDPGTAVRLLSRRLGGERVARERETAYVLAELCGGLPLALCLLAARGAVRPRQPLSALARAMDRAGDRLAAFTTGDDRAVHTALDQSYTALSPDVADAYRRLGLPFVVEFGPDLAAAACGRSRDAADELLFALLEVNLVEEIGPDRYRLHDLVRIHSARRAEQEDTAAVREASARRVLDWYLATSTAARALLSPGHRELRRDYAGPVEPMPFADGSTALRWFDGERLHLMAAVRAAVDRGHDATAWQLVDSMQPLFFRLRPYDLWIEAHRIGLAAAERAGHPEGVSRMLTTGGSGFYNAGRLDEAMAWFGRALEDARGDGDQMAQAQALHGIGQSHRLAGRLESASSFFLRALAIRESIGYVRGAALSRLCLGDIAVETGRGREAVALLSRARADLLAVPDPYDAARALAFLGRAHAAQDVAEFETAERRLNDALEEFTAAGSVQWQAHVLEMLGQTAADRHDRDRARDLYEQSLARYSPVSPVDAQRLEDRLRALDES